MLAGGQLLALAGLLTGADRLARAVQSAAGQEGRRDEGGVLWPIVSGVKVSTTQTFPGDDPDDPLGPETCRTAHPNAGLVDTLEEAQAGEACRIFNVVRLQQLQHWQCSHWWLASAQGLPTHPEIVAAINAAIGEDAQVGSWPLPTTRAPRVPCMPVLLTSLNRMCAPKHAKGVSHKVTLALNLWNSLPGPTVQETPPVLQPHDRKRVVTATNR